MQESSVGEEMSAGAACEACPSDLPPAAPAEFPPPGWTDRAGALKLLGLRSDALKRMYKAGRIRFGKVVAKPDRGWCKIYPIAELERVRDEIEAERGRLPEGYVRSEVAAARFGLSASGWKKWVAAGRVSPGEWVKVPGLRPMVRAYTIAQLDEIASRLDAEGKRYPKPKRKPAPERAAERAAKARHLAALRRGTVGVGEACAMFGVSVMTWRRWHHEGRVTGIQVNRAYRYDRGMVERLVAECGRLSPPYPDPERPGCYRVPLTGYDMRRREAIIDAEALPFFEGRHCYFTIPAPRPGETSRGERSGQVVRWNGVTPQLLRRLILGITDLNLRVSHINGDPLDCRRANLRVREMAEVCWNSCKARTRHGIPCSSRFKGVCWDRENEKWLVQIRKDGVGRKLGRFHDEIAAAQAYDDAASELFGEHAWLNFPDGVDARLEQEAREAEARERETNHREEIVGDAVKRAA